MIGKTNFCSPLDPAIGEGRRFVTSLAIARVVATTCMSLTCLLSTASPQIALECGQSPFHRAAAPPVQQARMLSGPAPISKEKRLSNAKGTRPKFSALRLRVRRSRSLAQTIELQANWNESSDQLMISHWDWKHPSAKLQRSMGAVEQSVFPDF